MKKICFSFYILITCLSISATTNDVTNNEDSYAYLGESNIEYECKKPKCIQNYHPESYPTNGIKNYTEENSTLQRTSTMLAKVIDNLPDKKLQNGLREYVKIVNPKAYLGDDSVGGANHGLNSWFDNKFKSNQCFVDAARSFYRDVALTMSKENKCDRQYREKSLGSYISFKIISKNENKTNEYGCFNERPSINDTVAKGRKAYLHEGWLLQLAMKHSQGSVEGAMELIGMCGHDDTSQGKFIFYDNSESAQAEIKQSLELHKSQKKEVDNQLKKMFKNFDSNNEKIYYLSRKSEKLQNKINEFQSKKAVRRRLRCPPINSDFYLPGSIGAEVDIPQKLKNKISNIQNPEGANSIPAKNYHVYGSTFLGCKMVMNGLSAEQAVMVQKQAARLYRGIRMCEVVRENLTMRNKFSDSEEDIENSKSIETKIIDVWTKIKKKNIICYTNVAELGGFGYLDDEQKTNGFNKARQKLSIEELKACETLAFFGISNLDVSEIDVARSKIAKAYSKYDAALLYDKWYVGGGSIFGKNLPCTDLRLRGPKDLMNPDLGILSSLSKPTGWSDERYKAATQKLATWDVDFEWTVKQHEIGSKFGAKVCKSNVKLNPFNDEKTCLKSANDPYYNNNSEKYDALKNVIKPHDKTNSSKTSR